MTTHRVRWWSVCLGATVGVLLGFAIPSFQFGVCSYDVPVEDVATNIPAAPASDAPKFPRRKHYVDVRTQPNLARCLEILESPESRETKLIGIAEALESATKNGVGPEEIRKINSCLSSLDNPAVVRQEAWALFDKGLKREATWLLSLITRNPHFDAREVEIGRAFALQLSNRFQEAIDTLKLISAQPDIEHRDLVEMLIAHAYLASGQLKEAEKTLTHFIESFRGSSLHEAAVLTVERIRPLLRENARLDHS